MGVLTRLDKGAFRYCTNLVSITLPFVGATKEGTTDTYFGYIFGASRHTKNSNYVPESLTTVITTDGTSIGDYALYGCSNLINITIPESGNSIGFFTFAYCTGLETVYYGGTVEKWAEISIGSNNELLTGASLYYFSDEYPFSDEMIDGNFWHYDEATGEIVIWTKEED